MRYERNYLTSVVFELRFDRILRLLRELPVEFQEAVRGTLPRLTPRGSVRVRGEVSEDSELVTEVEDRFTEWIFHNDDTGTSLLVGPSVLRYSQAEYAGAEGFDGRFLPLWKPSTGSMVWAS